VKILVSDLRENYSAQVTVLGLNGWVTELEAAQNDFEQIFIRRNKERADRPQEKLCPVRKREDAVYRSIVECIDAYSTLNGYNVTGQFVRELNGEVTYFNERTRRHAKKDIKNTTVATIPKQPWTGEPATPLPEVFDEEGRKLVFARDYEVTYRKNDRPGTAYLIIYGKGAWKGTRTVSFNIMNSGLADSNVLGG
jgi:hypothetical protein